jgi:hypothetical protein
LAEETQINEATVEESPEKKSRRKIILFAVLALLVVGGGLFYWHSTFTEVRTMRGWTGICIR